MQALKPLRDHSAQIGATAYRTSYLCFMLALPRSKDRRTTSHMKQNSFRTLTHTPNRNGENTVLLLKKPLARTYPQTCSYTCAWSDEPKSRTPASSPPGLFAPQSGPIRSKQYPPDRMS